MKQPFERFDMAREPVRTKWYLKPVTKLLRYPDMLIHRPVIRCSGTEGLKPPYLLLCNHNAFLDFKVATQVIYPNRANYVVAIDGFIGREWLLRSVGCICKRKFTNDIMLVRQLKKVIENGDPFFMEIPVPSLYSVHIEYEYLGKHGDCVDLNTLTDTWYTYPKDKPFAVTKMALATEELYYAYRRSIGKPCRTGLS